MQKFNMGQKSGWSGDMLAGGVATQQCESTTASLFFERWSKHVLLSDYWLAFTRPYNRGTSICGRVLDAGSL